jgi:signal peptidase II
VSGVPEANPAPGRPRWPLFVALAATVVVLDQLTKAWLVSTLRPGERMDVVGDILRFVHSQNSGALFGLFKDQAIIFGVASIVVIGLIVWYHGSSGRNTMLSIALGLLLGGAVGNMIDRFRYGYVVDWVDAGLGNVRFYTFNIADSMISTAILLLILLAIFPSLARIGSTADRSTEPTTDTPDATLDDDPADA